MAGKTKNRTLTPAEQKRTEYIEELIAREYTPRGFHRQELTVSLYKANLFALLLTVPAFGLSALLYILVNKNRLPAFGILQMILFLILTIVLIFVHEGIHGFVWSRYTEWGMKSIEFGFIKEALTPYCSCREPLKRKQYLMGVLMPFFLCGLLPVLIGILFNSPVLTMTGAVHITAAAGDLLIAWKIFRFRQHRHKVLYLDHPSKCGLIALVQADADYF